MSLSANLFNVGCKFVIGTHINTQTHTHICHKTRGNIFLYINELQVVTLAHTAFIREFCESVFLFVF